MANCPHEKKYILNKQNTEIKTEMSTTTRQNEQHIISGFVLPIKTSRAWNISIIFCLCLPRQFAIPKIVIVILGIQKNSWQHVFSFSQKYPCLFKSHLFFEWLGNFTHLRKCLLLETVVWEPNSEFTFVSKAKVVLLAITLTVRKSTNKRFSSAFTFYWWPIC